LGFVVWQRADREKELAVFPSEFILSRRVTLQFVMPNGAFSEKQVRERSA
jgi:hypothetical protein